MLAYTPDGKTLFTGDGSRAVRAWNLATGEQSVVVQQTSPFGAVQAQPLGVSPDGRRLAVWSAGLVLCEIGPIPPPSDRPAFIELDGLDGRHFRVAPGWTLTCLLPIYGFTSISPDWTVFVSVGYRGAHFWDVNTGKWQGGTFGSHHHMTTAAFSADGKTLAASVWEPSGYRILFWDVARRRRLGRITLCFGLNPLVPLFSPEGRWFAVFREAQVEFFDARSGRMTPEGSIRNPTRKHFLEPAFSPDGRRLLTTDKSKVIRLWDVESRQLLEEWNWEIGMVNWIRFAPDGQTAAAAGSGRKVVVWDIDQ